MMLASVPNSFIALAASRVLLGFVSSCFNPLGLSILSDYFPPDRRGLSNSIIQSGTFVGWGLSSLSIVAISQFGWRTTYGLLGMGSLVLCALFSLVLKEPERGRFVQKKEEDVKVINEDENKSLITLILENPTAKWVLIGNFLRNMGLACINSYLPVFFGRNFPLFKAEYSFANSIILSVLGMTSAITFGYLTDKFEKKSF